MSNFIYQKVLGYIDLPFMAPTSSHCSNGIHPFDEIVNGTFFGGATSPLSVAANWQSCAVGGGNANRFAKGGMLVVASKSEQKVCFIDLKPLFMGFYNQYFTSGGNPATATIGPADNQWPYTFVNSPSFAPTIVQTFTTSGRPSAVRVGAFSIDHGADPRAWVAMQDGTINIYSVSNYVPGGTAKSTSPAQIAFKGSVSVAANPVFLGSPKTDVVNGVNVTGSFSMNDRNLIVTCRGARKIQWVKFADDGNSGSVVMTLQDSRLIDPMSADDNDNFANTFSTVTVTDYGSGTSGFVRNYRYGPCVAAEGGNTPSGRPWSCQGGGCPVTGTAGINIEYGGGFAIPGNPYMGWCSNVP
jgi:hypothetical protein